GFGALPGGGSGAISQKAPWAGFLGSWKPPSGAVSGAVGSGGRGAPSGGTGSAAGGFTGSDAGGAPSTGFAASSATGGGSPSPKGSIGWSLGTLGRRAMFSWPSAAASSPAASPRA